MYSTNFNIFIRKASHPINFVFELFFLQILSKYPVEQSKKTSKTISNPYLLKSNNRN